MKRHFSVFLSAALLAGLGHTLVAQGRDQLIRDGVAAYNNFDPGHAQVLLRQGLNPALGAPDSSWARGVQLLAQILTESGDTTEAQLWARWAMRLDPTMALDTVTYLPEVTQAFRSAATAVKGGGPGDQATTTTWRWPQGTPGAQGALLVRSGTPGVALTVLITGRGVIPADQTVSLPPGTYALALSAPNRLGANVNREVLPGVTTVLTVNLPSASEGTLADDVKGAAEQRLARLGVHRFGEPAACAVGAFVGRQGLVVTTYTAVRGSDELGLRSAGGNEQQQGVSIAAYDVARNVAILTVPVVRTDSMALGSEPEAGAFVWGMTESGCQTPSESRARVATASTGPAQPLVLSDSVTDGSQGGPIVDRQGNLVGLLTEGPQSVPVSAVRSLLLEARQNVAQHKLLGVAEVARRENHAYGSMALTSDAAGASVHVTPLESWQWAATADSGALPRTFSGPMGRYHVDLIVDGAVEKQAEFTIHAGAQDRLAINLQVPTAPTTPQVAERKHGGHFPWPIAILGAAGAGAAVYFLAGSGGSGASGSNNTGSITFSVPNH